MPLTLNETNVSLNETFNEMLDDLQAGILKHHGREHAAHIFLRFAGPTASQWIKDYVVPRLFSARKQLRDVQIRSEVNPRYDGGPVYVLALSAQGYNRLDIEVSAQPHDAAFTAGMRHRKELSDKPDQWEHAFQEDIDAMIIIADDDRQKLELLVEQLTNTLTSVGAGTLVYTQYGSILRNEVGIGIEHFGYADGISQPLFLNDELKAKGEDDKAALNIILVKDKGGKYPDSCGSYLVFRKLEQNVQGFKDAEEAVSKAFDGGAGIKNKYGESDGELAGAMLIGRFEDGSPVITDSSEQGIISEAQFNNSFDYKTDSASPGSRCPFQAHIRLTNPRSTPGSDPFERITRRGIPYDDREHIDENKEPTMDVGLLFMCYQASIEKQFEVIQANANKGMDAVIGQLAVTSIRLPEHWGNNQFQTVNLDPKNPFNYVSNKGGEYFFTPSISFLKNLSFTTT